jgi:hypothetical protein
MEPYQPLGLELGENAGLWAEVVSPLSGETARFDLLVFDDEDRPAQHVSMEGAHGTLVEIATEATSPAVMILGNQNGYLRLFTDTPGDRNLSRLSFLGEVHEVDTFLLESASGSHTIETPPGTFWVEPWLQTDPVAPGYGAQTAEALTMELHSSSGRFLLHEMDLLLQLSYSVPVFCENCWTGGAIGGQGFQFEPDHFPQHDGVYELRYEGEQVSGTIMVVVVSYTR